MTSEEINHFVEKTVFDNKHSKEYGLNEEFIFQLIDGASKSPMIKQSAHKDEKDFTVWRIISSS